MNAIKERKIVYTSGQIAERVRAMAAEIDAFYGDEPLVAVCVLKGAVFFFTDLVRAMRSENLELDFVRLSSYGKGTSSSRHVVFSKDVDCDITGKHVLIVEDVVDSGLSMQFLMRQFEARGARSLRLAALQEAARIGIADIEAGRFQTFTTPDALGQHLAGLAADAIG